MSGRGATRAKDGFSHAPAAARAFQAAATFHRQGRLQEAAQLYRATLARDANNFLALHYLGTILADQGKLEDAVNLMRRALRQNAQSAEVHNNLGIALHALKRPAEAVEHYRKAIEINAGFA